MVMTTKAEIAGMLFVETCRKERKYRTKYPKIEIIPDGWDGSEETI